MGVTIGVTMGVSICNELELASIMIILLLNK